MIELLRIPMKQVCGYFLRWYYNGWHYWQFFAGTLGIKTEGMKYRTTGVRTIELSSGVLNYEQVEAIRSILNTTEVYLFTDGGWAEIRLEAGSTIVLKNDLQGYEVNIKANLGSRQVSATGLSPVIVIPEAPLPSYCEVKIGTQIWMCANWDAAYPGSKVYLNNEANRAIYGGLYTYNQIMSAGFCPDGWRIPTDEDWQTLIDFVGTGGKLKEIGTTHWDSPNTDATDDYDFTALGSGYLDNFGLFHSLKELTRIWSASKIGFYNRQLELSYDSAAADIVSSNPFYFYCPVRMIKNEAATYDWELQTIPAGTKILNSIMFYGGTGYAVGWTSGLQNLILKTTNGIDWSQQLSLIGPHNLYSVFAIDADIVLACGIDDGGPEGCIRKTTDGSTWSALIPAHPPAPTSLYDIMFTDANNGWAVGVDAYLKCYITKTTDGVNWSLVNNPFTEDGVLHSVFFIDANTGWVTGYKDSGFGIIYKHIYKTTNGGTSWTAQVSAFSGSAGSIRSIFMLDANTGWAVGNQGIGVGSLLIYHTINGTSWSVQTFSVSSLSGVLYGVHFIDANEGWCVGQSGTNILILHTTNGGTTWAQQTSIITTGSLRSIYAISETEAYAVGEDDAGNAILLKYS